MAISITVSIWVSTMAWIRSSLLGKRRNRVASPTPARWAISAVEASRPRSAKTSIAAAMIRSRLRWASARSSRARGLGCRHVPDCMRHRERFHRPYAAAAARSTSPASMRATSRRRSSVVVTTAPAPTSAGRDHERDLEPVHQRRALLRAVRERARGPVVGERREHREPERAAHLLGGVEHARREPRVLLGDVRGRDQGQGHEGQAHADRQRRERREQHAGRCRRPRSSPRASRARPPPASCRSPAPAWCPGGRSAAARAPSRSRSRSSPAGTRPRSPAPSSRAPSAGTGCRRRTSRTSRRRPAASPRWRSPASAA